MLTLERKHSRHTNHFGLTVIHWRTKVIEFTFRVHQLTQQNNQYGTVI